MAWTSREVAERLAAQMSSYREQLGRRVVRYREAKGWNQEDLAYHSGVSNRTIQRLERGQHDGRVKTIQALARALDVDESDLRGPPPEEAGDDLRPLVSSLAEQVARLSEQIDRLEREQSWRDAAAE